MAEPLGAIMKIEVPVIVQVAARAMPLEDVLAIGPGTIIDLPKSVDEPLEILVNNKPVGRGRAVRVGENYGVQVQHVGGLDSRIRAMGGKPGFEGEEPQHADDASTAGTSETTDAAEASPASAR